MIGRLFTDQATVEPFQGDGAHGPIYGPPVSVECRLQEATDYRTGNADQQQTTAATVLYLPYTAVVPARSRVTLPDGRVGTVTEIHRHRGRPGLRHQKVVIR
ncbi:hypothetical protein [Actinomadura gamaensis]|uniref:Head-to-tail stopper n=1 Tax=Actinomadura gamaensis TaxID=1763541 RepID=A0ABV9U7Q7_9ACTN